MRLRSLLLATAAALASAPALAQSQCGLLSQCPNASVPFSGTELIYLVQDGVSKKTTLGQIGTGGNVQIPTQPAQSILYTQGVSPPLTLAPVANGVPFWDAFGVLRAGTTLPAAVQLNITQLAPGTAAANLNASLTPGTVAAQNSAGAFVAFPFQCSAANLIGFVADGLTLNDTAFNNWYNSLPSIGGCLQFGVGKYAFGSQINKTLSPNAQTVEIASGTYNSATGLVTLTLDSAATFSAGVSLVVWNLTGTGAFGSLNGEYVVASAVGTTVTYFAQSGLGAATITDGAIAAASKESIALLGVGSHLTTLYWSGSGGGIKLTSGGTSSSFEVFNDSVHIRDMTLATGVAGGGTAIDLEGFPYTFGVPPTTDVANVEIRGDDYIPPNHGAYSWTIGVDMNCWSNISIFNVNTWGVYTSPVGIGMRDGCNSANDYAVILNISHSSMNNGQYGLVLLSDWQGVVVDTTNFNSFGGASSAAGIIQAGGQVGVLSGLTITNSQFGGFTAPIAINPATGEQVDDVQIVNNIIYVPAANDIGITLGSSSAPGLLATIVGNVVIGEGSPSNTYGASIGTNGAAIVGNTFSNLTNGYALTSVSSNSTAGANAFTSVSTKDINNGSGNTIVSGAP